MESISKSCILPDGPIHLLIDSTGRKSSEPASGFRRSKAQERGALGKSGSGANSAFNALRFVNLQA